MMRKILTTLFALLVLPAFAFAAYNDVQLSSGSTIVLSVGGSNVEFSASGGTIQDIQVAGSNVTFTMAPGSTVSMNSTSRTTYTYQAGRATASFTCTDSASVLNVSLASSEPNNETLVVTPTATPAPAPSSVAVVTAPAVAQPSPVAQLVSPVFNKDLVVGAKGDDVKRLQELLKTDASVYPTGQVTGYFGPLTKAAIVKFQLKYGVIKSDKEVGAGRLGPKTRAKIKVIFEGAAPASTPVPASTPAPAAVSGSAQSIQAQIQALLKTIQELQAKIKAQSQ
ncbi:MAG: hypothetical protein UY12_C0043G0006 [Parcubacteria group bacterium GW2011_GWA2_47_8b]|nr:MAG: hypothetical protein UY12_C0043G0006 [Parcubacteria group bacterium GW2011_GWA2_47_8b]